MEIVNTLLTLVHEYLLQPAIQHTGYVLHVKNKIKKLRDEMDKLMATEEDVKRKLEVAQDPSNLVQMWQSKVKRLKEEVERDINVELTCGRFCPNFLSRYKLGKRVTKEYLVGAKEFRLEGSGFLLGTIDLNLPISAEANFEALREEVNALSQIEAGVNSMVEESERVHGLQSKHQVEDWLKKVIAHKHGVDDVSHKFQEIMKEKNYGEKKVLADLNSKMHKIVEKTKTLVSEGQGFGSNVSDPSRPIQVVRQYEINSIGQEKAFKDVLNLIRSTDYGLIGIYGMGGVGKTTLMKRINNSLVGLGYEIVIFVVVSTDGNTASVQKDIMKRLGKDVENTSYQQRQTTIYNILKHKKFILILDDIWTVFDLVELGVPRNIYEKNINSKILSTTRFENVCDQMQATKTKIECLNDKEAWELFAMTVGGSILDSNFVIKEIADEVVRECGGLPLALTVVGGAMRSKRAIPEWEHALSTLRKSQPELTGTEENLYNRLKFSYDSLGNDTMRECFCYCALFPEDYEIDPREIVGCWIGEGFFKECNNIDEARNKGYTIIEDLKQACLLEGLKDDDDVSVIPESIKVKLHDVVRDMALWIKKDKFLVFTIGAKVPDKDKCPRLQRLSIISDGKPRTEESEKKEIPLDCPHLSTFFIGKENLNKLSNQFFKFMPNLKVVSVYSCINDGRSGNDRLPPSVWNLVKLRYLNLGRINEKYFVRGLGQLQSLEQLTMEVGLGQLQSLEQLKMEMMHLEVVKRLELKRLEQLKVKMGLEEVEELGPEELKRLEQLKVEMGRLKDEIKRLEKLKMEMGPEELKSLEQLTIKMGLGQLQSLEELVETGFRKSKSTEQLTKAVEMGLRELKSLEKWVVEMGLRDLKSLEQVVVESKSTKGIWETLGGVIGRHTNLCALQLWRSSNHSIGLEDYGLKIGELKCLLAIEDLVLPIKTSSYLRELAACPKLARSVSHLHLCCLDMKSFRLPSEVGSMNRLKSLTFYNWPSLEKIVMDEEGDGVSLQNPKLTTLLVQECARLRTLTITQRQPIRRLHVIRCSGMEQVFIQSSRSKGSDEYVFRALQKIELHDLLNLKSICSDTFKFPRLEVLKVKDCYQLRKLPRGIIQASRVKGTLLREIRGEPEWWNGLEWDSEEDKTSLLPLFKPNYI